MRFRLEASYLEAVHRRLYDGGRFLGRDERDWHHQFDLLLERVIKAKPEQKTLSKRQG